MTWGNPSQEAEDAMARDAHREEIDSSYGVEAQHESARKHLLAVEAERDQWASLYNELLLVMQAASVDGSNGLKGCAVSRINKKLRELGAMPPTGAPNDR